MPPIRRGHFSMRPQRTTLERLDDRARLSGMRRSELAERYLQEGLLMDEFPGIHFVDGALGRRPALLGTGLDVWEVVKVVRDNEGSVDDAAAYLEIEPRIVGLAVSFYGSNREAVDAWIARVEELSEREEAKSRAAARALSV
jgi:hypothetical protein